MNRKDFEQLKEDINNIVPSDEYDALIKRSQELDELLLENIKN